MYQVHFWKLLQIQGWLNCMVFPSGFRKESVEVELSEKHNCSHLVWSSSNLQVGFQGNKSLIGGSIIHVI